MLSFFNNITIFEFLFVKAWSRGSCPSIIFNNFDYGFVLVFGDLTTVLNNDWLDRSILSTSRLSLDDVEYVPTRYDFTKDHMLAVEMRGRLEAQEELRAIGAWSGISHGKTAAASMLILEVFVFEFVSVNGFTSSSIAVCKITTLSHEARDDAMEGAAFEVQILSFVTLSFLASTESSEVFARLWCVLKQFHGDLANVMAIHRYFKEDFGLLVNRCLLLFIFLNANLLEACWLLFRLGCLLGWSFNHVVIDNLFGFGLGCLDAVFLPLKLLSGILKAHINILVIRVLLKDELEVADG